MNSDPGMRRYGELRRMVDRRVMAAVGRSGPRTIQRSLRTVVTAGGKRIRPVLLLISCEAVGGRVRDALDAAAAVELMHNFTLVHDDIMDNAPTRHGRPTVHKHWGVSQGILAGDVLVGLAYECFLKTKALQIRRLTRLFTDCLLKVCEGQGVDLEFGARKRVRLPDYFRMIEKKTAAMFSTSTMIGGVIGSGTDGHVRALQKFGFHLGRAFQIQDDLLDVVAKERTFGKALGGDIMEGKKTFLLLKAGEKARGKAATLLARVADSGQGIRHGRGDDFVRKVTDLYRQLGAIDAARKQIASETEEATRALSRLPRNRGTAMLRWMSGMLLGRVA